MFTVPRSFVAPPAWKIIGLWVRISVFGALLSRWFIDLVFTIFASITISTKILFGIMSPGNALIIYSLQWFVLRRYFLRVRSRIIIHVSLSVIASVLSDLLQRLSRALIIVIGFWRESTAILQHADFLAGTIINLLWALILGIAGWRIFRASVPKAKYWIWATIANQIIRSGLTFRLIVPFSRTNTAQTTALYIRLISLVITLIPTLIESFVLVRFLAKRRETASG